MAVITSSVVRSAGRAVLGFFCEILQSPSSSATRFALSAFRAACSFPVNFFVLFCAMV